MYEEIVENVLRSIKSRDSEESYPKFSSKDYVPFKVEKSNFHEIKNASGKIIAFIDGGNAEVIGSGNFSLQLMKVSCVVIDGNRVSRKKAESFVLLNSMEKDGEIYYKATVFNRDFLDDVSFSSMDETMKNGINRADIKNAANAVRRLAELNMAKNASDSKIADIIVLDGTLQCSYTNEESYLNALYSSCTGSNVILCALSKTNSVFTDNGNLMNAALEDIAPSSSWVYHPVAEINSNMHQAEMFFVKFHEKSRHAFRFEILKSQKQHGKGAIACIASNCNDLVFIGYPFGLVEADRIARVSNDEKESLKTIFTLKLKEKNISRYINASNAHEILDKISF